jgi:Tfp pilus assembly protein PilW
MKNIIAQNPKGFTLIELLLYVSITSLLLTAVSFFLATLLEARIKNQTIAEVEQQGLQVVQMMTQAIRNASAVNAPAQGVSGASLSVGSYTPALDPTIFDLSGGVLRMKEGAGAAIDLTNSRVVASGVTFSNLSRTGTPGTVRIQFTLTHVNSDNRNIYDFSKTFTAAASLRQP